MMAVSWYANGPSDREGMGQLTFSGPTVSGESGSNEDLNDAFEERGWVLGWYAYRGGTGRTSRFKSGCGRWQMDATVDASERYGPVRTWHSSRYQTICNSFGKYASDDGGNVNLDCGDTSEVGVRPSDLAMGILLDPDKPYLRYSMTGLPTGLEFDPENRVIHGILPTASSSVNTTVTYKATDFLNNTTSLTFTLTAVGNQDANHVDAAAAAAAAAAQAALDAAEAAAAAAAALAAAQADQYASEQAAAEAMVILGSGIRRTRDLSSDLVRPEKYLDVDLLTSDDPKGIPMAVAPPIERDMEPEIALAIPDPDERRAIRRPQQMPYTPRAERTTGQGIGEKMRERMRHMERDRVLQMRRQRREEMDEMPEQIDDYTF